MVYCNDKEIAPTDVVIEERHVAQTFSLCYNADELVNSVQINKCTRGCSELGNRL